MSPVTARDRARGGDAAGPVIADMNETGAPACADWLDALTTTAIVCGRR
jgi:hypothetical protein